MRIVSPAFKHLQPIPKKFTCEGENISPPLNVADVPKNVKSLALIMEDPDNPLGTKTHWIAWNIEPITRIFQEGAKLECEGKNGNNMIGYAGPCPQQGSHRYFFKLFALDAKLELAAGSSKQELESAMQGHIIDQAEYIGTYQKGLK